jgi:UDPglucose 6-dehydrogenase
MRVAMIGCGYVGLVSGACFSDFGHDVHCVDLDSARVEALRSGRVPLHEPGLDDLIARNVAADRLHFGTDYTSAVDGADIVFIAVGTPARRGDGHADLSYVREAVRSLAPVLPTGCVVVTKSTVPVGTGDAIEALLHECRPDLDVSVASNPEFLREGSAVHDFKHPDRIVLGAEDARAREVLTRLYRPLHLNRGPLLFTDRRTAELIKYASNAFLATKISFINEMADLCEVVGADVQELARGMGLDRRIGPKFLHPGPGYGGSCFPKDTEALCKTARDAGRPLRIVETVRQVNEARKRSMASRIADAAGGLEGKRVAVLGLTFKPNTDDLREAPSLTIVPALQEMGAEVHAHDPAGMGDVAEAMPGLHLHDTPYSALEGADVLVILTEWDAFRALDLERARAAMRGADVVDLRNIYEPGVMAEMGFVYTGVGLGRGRLDR